MAIVDQQMMLWLITSHPQWDYELADGWLGTSFVPETADVFFYDLPTLRYLPPVYYWLARAQEGMGVITLARQNYELFLKLRADAKPADLLAVDARRRVSSS